MAIEHDYFGLLESGPDGSLFWSETVEFSDQSVTVALTAPGQDGVLPAAHDVAAALLLGLAMDISGDTHIDVIRSLQLTSMTILADEHGGDDPFAVLEYALDPDAADDVLLVNLASDGHIQSVTSAD